MTNQIMREGKTGLFGTLERAANLRNSRVLVALTVVLLAISVMIRYTVPELGGLFWFVWLSAGMVPVSLAELFIVRRKDGTGKYLKWVLGVSFVASAAITTSTIGAVGGIIFVFPLLLSIPYCSVLFSVFMSVIAVMGTFIPLLLSSYLTYYDINVLRLAPGTVIKVTSTLGEAIDIASVDEAGTKINELLAVSLPVLVLTVIAAVVIVIITAAVRKMLLEQYHQFQTTRE